MGVKRLKRRGRRRNTSQNTSIENLLLSRLVKANTLLRFIPNSIFDQFLITKHTKENPELKENLEKNIAKEDVSQNKETSSSEARVSENKRKKDGNRFTYKELKEHSQVITEKETK